MEFPWPDAKLIAEFSHNSKSVFILLNWGRLSGIFTSGGKGVVYLSISWEGGRWDGA